MEPPFNPPVLCRYLSERSPVPTIAVEGTSHVVSYLNPAFARFVGRGREELVGRPFAEAVPEGDGNGCVALLDRVYRTGTPETLAEQEHRQVLPRPVFWSYAVWAILGPDEKPTGVMVQVTDSTETALYRRQATGVNEALLVSAARQHEQAADAESLNHQLREAHDRLEERVAERTAELAAANARLRAEIEAREATESERRELQRRLDSAQEEERQRISRDLHDSVGQLVTGLILAAKAARSAGTLAEAAARVDDVLRLSDAVGRELHGLAVRLRPTALDDLGLEAALEQLVREWARRTGVSAEYQATGLGRVRLPAEVETTLYRVAQESLTNVAKHAKATAVAVTVGVTEGVATVVVEDDGEGFDAGRGVGGWGWSGCVSGWRWSAEDWTWNRPQGPVPRSSPESRCPLSGVMDGLAESRVVLADGNAFARGDGPQACRDCRDDTGSTVINRPTGRLRSCSGRAAP